MVRSGAPASIEAHPKDHMTVTRGDLNRSELKPHAQPNPRGPRPHAVNGDRSYDDDDDDDDGELTFTEANPPTAAPDGVFEGTEG